MTSSQARLAQAVGGAKLGIFEGITGDTIDPGVAHLRRDNGQRRPNFVQLSQEGVVAGRHNLGTRKLLHELLPVVFNVRPAPGAGVVAVVIRAQRMIKA